MPVIIGDETIRNIPEQVAKNSEDVQELKADVENIRLESGAYVKKSDIVNNLDSNFTQKPLSAKQGNVLKQMITDAVSGVYKPMGSLTVAQINALDTSALKVGYVYNILDSGTIVLGNLNVNAGDNVVWTVENDIGKWDSLSGTIDISNLVNLDGEQVITGLKTFDNLIKFQKSSDDPSDYVSMGLTNTGGYHNFVLYRRKNGSNGLYIESELFTRLNIIPRNQTETLGNSSYYWADIRTKNIAFDNYKNIKYDNSGGIIFELGSGNYPFQVYQNSVYIGKKISFTNQNVDIGENDSALRTIYLNNIAAPLNAGNIGTKELIDNTKNNIYIETISNEKIRICFGNYKIPYFGKFKIIFNDDVMPYWSVSFALKRDDTNDPLGMYFILSNVSFNDEGGGNVPTSALISSIDINKYNNFNFIEISFINAPAITGEPSADFAEEKIIFNELG